MFLTTDELAVLFLKIERGDATEEERIDYEASIKASCVNEAVLRASIKKKAKNLTDGRHPLKQNHI